MRYYLISNLQHNGKKASFAMTAHKFCEIFGISKRSFYRYAKQGKYKQHEITEYEMPQILPYVIKENVKDERI